MFVTVDPKDHTDLDDGFSVLRLLQHQDQYHKCGHDHCATQQERLRHRSGAYFRYEPGLQLLDLCCTADVSLAVLFALHRNRDNPIDVVLTSVLARDCYDIHI